MLILDLDIFAEVVEFVDDGLFVVSVMNIGWMRGMMVINRET